MFLKVLIIPCANKYVYISQCSWGVLKRKDPLRQLELEQKGEPAHSAGRTGVIRRTDGLSRKEKTPFLQRFQSTPLSAPGHTSHLHMVSAFHAYPP